MRYDLRRQRQFQDRQYRNETRIIGQVRIVLWMSTRLSIEDRQQLRLLR